MLGTENPASHGTWLPVLIVFCLLAPATGVAAVRLYPVDETGRDAEFRSFLKKLRSSVEARSTKTLRKLVDDEVVTGPSADATGWARFVERWHPDDAKSELWPALADLLSLGFLREHPSLFVSPYLVWRFPRELNPGTHLVVIRDNVALRVGRSARAAVAASLSFDIVEKLGEPENGDGLSHWVHIRTLDGQAGYVNARDVMSPLMPRAQFGRKRGRWMLMALEGGEP